MWEIIATCCSILTKIIAFTRVRLCNLKILLDFQALLKFLPSPYDRDRSGRSLEFDQNQINQLKGADFPLEGQNYKSAKKNYK